MTDSPLQMSLLGHIKELRNRLLVCVIALAVTVILSFTLSQKFADMLAGPIGGLQAMSSIDVTENMSSFMKISLLSGVIMALPIIIFQVLAFIMSGLNPSERAWIWTGVPLATIFFIAGVAFAYFVMLPAALPFLINFMGITTNPRPNTYFSFVTNLMFWVGVVFEMPLLMYMLARLNIVTAKKLVKQWRIALVASAILSALITPTADPVNMSLMMLPLFVLYLISIGFAVIARRSGIKAEKKVMSKRKLITLLVIIALLIGGVVFVCLQYPQEVLEFYRNVRSTLLYWLQGINPR